MLDRTTLSSSQRSQIPPSTEDNVRNTDKTSVVVPDLSASMESLRHKTGLAESVQEGIEIASSIELPAISSTQYSWQERESAEFFLFIGRLGLLEQRYSLRERAEAVQVLEKYPHLTLLLLDIYRQIVTYFPDARFFLKAITDFEEDLDQQATDGGENVVISVETRMRPREALEKLKQFYKNWWLIIPTTSKIKDMISFNLECI